jgi:hypothetical protein
LLFVVVVVVVVVVVDVVVIFSLSLFIDPGLRLACGFTFQAMTRYSPDVMKRHLTKALPTAYFAMHEKKKTG